MASADTYLPVISVITVVMNGAAVIADTIDSVLGQPYGNLRYIIIDGGSTDGTVAVIRRYEDRITYWVSEKDRGIYDAMNKGWALAEPESFILFIGAGDILLSLPEKMDGFATNDIFYGNVLLGNEKFFRSDAGWRLKIYNSLHHQALLVNKQIHPEPPFDTRFRLYADFDFNQRLKKAGVRFVFSAGFCSSAMPGGVTDKGDFTESLFIIRKNYGLCWALIAMAGYIAMAVLPPLRGLRPFVKLSDNS